MKLVWLAFRCSRPLTVAFQLSDAAAPLAIYLGGLKAREVTSSIVMGIESMGLVDFGNYIQEYGSTRWTLDT